MAVRKMWMIWIAVFLVASGLMRPHSAKAAAEVDFARKGTILVEIRDPDTNALYGEASELEVFYLASLSTAQRGEPYQLREEFKDLQISFSDLSAAAEIEIVKTVMADIAANRRVPFKTLASEDGSYEIQNLDHGIYVFNYKSVGKKLEIAPFLISSPGMNLDDDSLLYEQVVYPKYGISTDQKPTPSPLATPAPKPTGVPSPRPQTSPKPSVSPKPAPKDPYLPQTGLLRWPVLLLTAVGSGLVTAGMLSFVNRKRKPGKGRSCRNLSLFGVVLLLGAMGLVAHNTAEGVRAGVYSRTLLSQMELHETKGGYVAAETEEAGEGASQTSEETGDTDEAASEMKTVVIDGKPVIGKLAIPAIGIEGLPILSVLSDENLRSAPCVYMGNYQQDSLIVAAHNYEVHFANLQSLTQDDDILFADMDGNEYRYRVTQTEILAGNEVARMQAGVWDLTLFTCTYSGAERVTVRCERVS